MRRREVIKTGVCATGLLGLAGCSGGGTGTEGESTSQSRTTTGGSAGSQTSSAGGDAIKIGTLHALAPPVIDAAKQEQRGVKLAVNRINEAGGIDGQQVEVIHENTNANPKTALEKAQRLIENENVDLLYGANLSPSALRIAPYTNEENTPYLTPVSSTALAGEACQQSTFPTNIDPTTRSKAIVPTMLERSGSQGWIHILDFAWGHDVRDGVQAALADRDAEVLDVTTSALDATDFSNVVSQISSADPDWAYLGVAGGALVGFLKQAQQFGLAEQVDLYGPASSQPTRQGAGGAIEGYVSQARFTPFYDSAENDQFVSSFAAEYDSLPNDYAKDAWEALHLYKAAVEEAGTTSFGDVTAALESVQVVGPMGEVSFRECDHSCQRPVHVAEMVASEEYGYPCGDIITTLDSESKMVPCEESGCSR
ncbi:ABC transporter substrate-binding protein [Halobellus sp. GM3]|uniref:ABC transporter substrate-binding protein n=1 Tax=Halobellus sp. GM3 TaxID=3458410 RepID=UPI00403DC203